jgi:aryl-phospho-beta-D-glucosidase BglC (GH1 family)
VGTVEIINPGPADLLDWQVDVTFAGTVTNSWNARSISRTGSVYRFGSVEYNRVVKAGSSVSFGFQGTPGGVSSLGVSLVGATGGTTTGGTTSGGTTGGTTTGGTTSGGTTGGTTTGGTTSGGTTGGTTTGGAAVGAGYFHTDGARIVDEQGRTVRLTGVNWFGLETSDFAPHGLWARSLNSMVDQMAQEGYNCIRLPFCNQMLDASSRPGTINYALNPDLVGKSSLEIMDRIIARAQYHGMKVILDRHRPTGDSQSELWYTSAISEERWISDFEMLARRYQGNPTVIGFDLHNEPHGQASWGSGNLATDWRLAAQRAGNRILAVNPNLLIIVEGVETAGGRNYWWGGNLKAAGSHPVVLNVPRRVVYSTHDYPASVYNQVWFSQSGYPNNLAPLWDECWGYLVKQNLAPVLVGEFGTRYQTQLDRQWLTTLTGYMQSNGISFTYWSWNPNSTDTGGLLQDDWQTVIADKKAVLAPLLGPLFK